MLTEACQHASGRAFCLSTRCIKKHPLLHCDVSRPLNYVGACSLRPCRHGAPRRLPLTQFVTNARPRAAQPPASRSTSLRVASSWALLLGTPPGQQPGRQPGYKQGPCPRIEVREQRVGTRTGAEQQSPGHCVQGTLAFASREGRDWLKCLHPHGLFTHATGQRVLLARRCLPARRLLTGNHVGLHPHHCPCPCPCPCLPASLPHCSHGARKGSPKPLHRALVLACSGLGPGLGADLRELGADRRERGRAHPSEAQRCLKLAGRFSRKARMPSFWSSVAKRP